MQMVASFMEIMGKCGHFLNTWSSNRDKMQLAHSPGFCVAIFLSTPALFTHNNFLLFLFEAMVLVHVSIHIFQ